MRLALALALLLAPGVVGAQDTTAEAAGRAARQLEEAARLLDEATGAEDRLAALTGTVRAYEEGLALMRDGLRAAAIERRSIEAAIEADRGRIAQLPGVMQSMGQAPAPTLLLHPAGPLGTARAGMILAEVTPALQAQADALRARLEALGALEKLQAEAEGTLREGLRDVQAARTALAAAASDRTTLPRAYAEDAVATALLLASTETLDAFAAGLDATEGALLSTPRVDASARAGTLALPVDGTVLRGPGEADASGAARPGLVIATEPRALVSVPVASTLRFRGPLLDYGTVAILEPSPGTLFVVAGLAQVFGNAGEVLPEGAPLGLMGGETPGADAILSGEAASGGAARSETLYLEVREGDGPVDPSTWFALPPGEQSP